MSTNVVTWIAAFVVAGAIVFAVFVGEDLGWGAGMTFAVVGAAAAVVLIPVTIWLVVRKKRRRREFGMLATQMGLRMVPEHALALMAIPFRLFSQGQGREIESVALRQADGRSVWLFDFMYYQEGYNPQSSSTTRHDYEYTCAVTQVAATTPTVVVGREGFFSRIARAIGFEDVEVGDEAFDRAFKVRSSDPAFVRALFHPDMRAWLLSLDGRWSFELVGGYLMACAERLPIPHIQLAEAMAFEFWSRVPPHLLSEASRPAPAP
ncbi:MAG: hypothetical protein ACRDJP_00025 [Actinomycetota bacterium]